MGVLVTVLACVVALGGCADSDAASVLPGTTDVNRYDAIIMNSPVADPASITPGSWADRIRQRGTLNVGSGDTLPLFALRDPTTGRVTGFDAGLAEMLAHYITGKPTNDVAITPVTVDTRETLLRNGTVDAVVATYSITPERAAKVAFAGPYYSSGDAIMVTAGDGAIHGVGDLNGKTVATQSNSTAVLALRAAAPAAHVVTFEHDPECVAAVQQGRADAYVLDQVILVSDASTNPGVKVVGEPFTRESYGIGLPLGDPAAKAFVNEWLRKIYANGSWAKLWKATLGTVVSGAAPTPPAIGSVVGS
ncbi:glutamate ABC transporter substrate-binding protein [Pseudonocardia yunnanensis]|uniref:Glutamate ABC transporter substrate-binding protein n=1 Tax=Pseudonocardia yunnanensis TaxID=58107 RepID=A0ABW4EP55_9PSEU